MTIFERLDRIQRVALLADLLRQRTYTAGLYQNHRVVAPEPPRPYDSMQAQISGQSAQYYRLGGGAESAPKPEPKGKWIACIGTYDADHDDPEQAVIALERIIVEKAQTSWRNDVADRRRKLNEAEQLLRDIEAATAE